MFLIEISECPDPTSYDEPHTVFKNANRTVESGESACVFINITLWMRVVIPKANPPVKAVVTFGNKLNSCVGLTDRSSDCPINQTFTEPGVYMYEVLMTHSSAGHSSVNVTFRVLGSYIYLDFNKIYSINIGYVEYVHVHKIIYPKLVISEPYEICAVSNVSASYTF